MCGICGYINFEREKRTDLPILKGMTQTLIRRGPDEEGYFQNENVGFGFRRLRIIDLETGSQPIYNEDKSIAVVLNGEIYNFKELRKELEKEHHFYTKTDTEVLVHLYEEYKESMLKYLNGMFSFALWDNKQKKLFCARDRMGQKPFYYLKADNLLAFASEPKALLKHPDVTTELDRESLRHYLLYEYVPAPRSIFKGIKKLPAAHFLILNEQMDLHLNEYWRHDFSVSDFENPKKQNVDKFYRQRIVELLRNSVQRRLISDVPLGAFLSGGIDSSLIVSLMADFMPRKDIKTFSIGFLEKSFDESKYADIISKTFGTDHHHKILDPKVMLDILPEIFSYVDEPFADASVIPTHLLSKFAKEHVTVALGGDGGDELFCGYDTFIAHRLMHFYRSFPGPVKQVISSVANNLPTSFKNMSFDFKLKRFLSASKEELGLRNTMWLGSFNVDEQAELLDENVSSVQDDIYGNVYKYLDDVSDCDDMHKLVYLYLKQYLQDDILFKVDRASMATSLEVRSPFLDVEFVEFVNSIPSHLKLKGFTTKYILKKAAQGRLPANIINRFKKGFGVPVGEWFRSDLKGLVQEILGEEKIKREGLFNYRYIEKLLSQHFSGKKDNRKQIWALFAFELWYSNFLKS